MRSSRILSILMALQVRGRVTAEELASEFSVSVRTIYRDLDDLSATGIPVIGDRGPGGGFALKGGYRTKLTGLTNAEAEALLLVGLPDQAHALGLGAPATRAREKLFAALTREGSTDASRFSMRFHLDATEWYRNARPVPSLALIARAVLDQKVVDISYQSWTALRSWRLEPLGLVLKSGRWYLVANGHGKTRTFNVADIHQAHLQDEAFTRPAGFELAKWWTQSLVDFEARLRPLKARLKASPDGLQRIRSLGAYASAAVDAATAPDARGWQCLSLPIETVELAARMLLGIGPEVAVLSPASLRSAVRALALRTAHLMTQR